MNNGQTNEQKNVQGVGLGHDYCLALLRIIIIIILITTSRKYVINFVHRNERITKQIAIQNVKFAVLQYYNSLSCSSTYFLQCDSHFKTIILRVQYGNFFVAYCMFFLELHTCSSLIHHFYRVQKKIRK